MSAKSDRANALYRRNLEKRLQTTVTLTIKFCAAHRLMHHPGKCSNLHGHNYRADIVVAGPVDPKTGMVVDFARVKEIIGGWIDKEWDHKTILNVNDPFMHEATEQPVESPTNYLTRLFGHVPFAMPCEPTAENMAAHLARTDWFKDYRKIINLKVRVVSVTLYETDTCSATCGENK